MQAGLASAQHYSSGSREMRCGVAVAGSELVRLSFLLEPRGNRQEGETRGRIGIATRRPHERITRTCNPAQNDILHVLQNACLCVDKLLLVFGRSLSLFPGESR